MNRSQHIALRVPADKVQAAAAHYEATLGLKRTAENADGVELAGPNFMLYVEPTAGEPMLLQEFVAEDREAVRSRLEQAGCTLFEESDAGFHVLDPFGMHYHVWIEKKPSPTVA